MKSIPVLMLAVAAAAAGCTTVYEKPAAKPIEVTIDGLECQEAAREDRILRESFISGRQDVIVSTVVIDKQRFRDCMEARGYQRDVKWP